MKSAGFAGTSGNSSMTSLNFDSEGKVNYGSSCSSADSGVEMGTATEILDQEALLASYTAGNITDSLYESVDDFCPTSKNIVKQKCDPSVHVPPSTKSRPATVEKSPNHGLVKKISTTSSQSISLDGDDANSFSLSLTDSTVLEGCNAITLLSDVLRDCSNMNNFSAEDFDTKDSKKETLKIKKSSDFEARMASVAATLDLTKPQQRTKRQIQRPPVSPPPEPNTVVSPKKVVNQPDLVLKCGITPGKINTASPSQLEAATKSVKPTTPSSVVEDSTSLLECSDNMSNKTVVDGKSKKGISSFFRNILRKGKGSSENLESMNSDVRLERKDSSSAIGSLDLLDEDSASSSVDHNLGFKSCPQGKFLFTPPTSPAQQRCDTVGTVISDTTSSAGENSWKVESDIQQSQTLAAAASSANAASSSANAASSSANSASVSTTASPLVQQKTSKGIASPTMLLKRAAAKCSPPTTRHSTKSQDKEQETVTASSSSSSSARPNPAPKPVVPPPAKPAVTALSDCGLSTTAGSVKDGDVVGREKESSPCPGVVRRRGTSPKRAIPPVPPTRTSVGAVKASDPKNTEMAKEVEPRQPASDQSDGGTLSRSDLRESTRRSMPVPPSRPGDKKEKPANSGSPPISPIPDTENSLPSSPASPTTTSFDFANTEWSGGSSSTIDDDLPKFSERIELPTVATQSRKGFLGKLSGNRKMRTPQPVPVKRAKSITEASTLPRGDKKSKKINVADISGPVIVTDITGGRASGNRRNTISLGSDPSFALLSSTMAAGKTTSSASIDKSSFDEFDIPILSPLGSLENLYESILPKPEGSSFHYYDPPTGPKVLCPNIPSDGYLEPVPPLSATAVASTPSSLSPAPSSTLVAASSTLPASSSLSSASIATTNSSLTKSPLKSKTSFSRTDRAFSTLPRGYKASSSSLTSASSSETNSTENSGNSLPDTSCQASSKIISEVSAKIGCYSLTSLSASSSGLGPSFVEPEMTEQRRLLLASQPIYEEIPNGGGEVACGYEDGGSNAKKGRVRTKAKVELPTKKTNGIEGGVPVQKAGAAGERTKGQTWLQQSQTVEPPQVVAPLSSSSVANILPLGASSSPSHAASKQNQAPTSLALPSSLSMTSSQIMSSSMMATSLTSSMLPPPPPPPDHLPAPQHIASRSASRETVSSESDAQSSCSNFSKPRPVPRQKPRRPYTGGGADQYVSMNRPNTQVSLSEDKLRDVFTKLTNITFHALQDIYAQCERSLSLDRLSVPSSRLLKWADFDIYGQPLHASGRCVVYNAKLQASGCPCQIMILHSRPATEMCATSHPSLLRPSAIFADTIPFSFLTPDFIKTSQLLQNSVYASCQARCFVAVGAFDIVESLESHLALLRETMAQDLNSYLSVILTATLQLLSAMSHCLDQGFSVTETDYNDVFLITRTDLRGKVVAFLPHQRSLDVPQGEAMCNFLERLLTDALPLDDDDDIDDEADVDDEEGEKVISSPKKVVAKLHSLLEPRRVECLGQVRTAVEYLLWGPSQSELPLSPSGPKPAGRSRNAAWSGASREQELYVWLEKERVSTVCRLARVVPGLGSGLTLEEFYTLKFLLKSSAACLAESLRRLSR